MMKILAIVNKGLLFFLILLMISENSILVLFQRPVNSDLTLAT